MGVDELRAKAMSGKQFVPGAGLMWVPLFDAVAVVQRAERRVAETEAALWRCVELSGADTSDGLDGGGRREGLPVEAVEEVGRLRRESDEDSDAAERRVRDLEAALEEARTEFHYAYHEPSFIEDCPHPSCVIVRAALLASSPEGPVREGSENDAE